MAKEMLNYAIILAVRQINAAGKANETNQKRKRYKEGRKK